MSAEGPRGVSEWDANASTEQAAGKARIDGFGRPRTDSVQGVEAQTGC